MEKKLRDMIDKKMRRYFLWIGAGMVLGYLYYYFIGCASGTCPISSNPLMSIVYGGVMGWLLSGLFEKEETGKRADHRQEAEE